MTAPEQDEPQVGELWLREFFLGTNKDGSRCFIRDVVCILRQEGDNWIGENQDNPGFELDVRFEELVCPIANPYEK